MPVEHPTPVIPNTAPICGWLPVCRTCPGLAASAPPARSRACERCRRHVSSPPAAYQPRSADARPACRLPACQPASLPACQPASLPVNQAPACGLPTTPPPHLSHALQSCRRVHAVGADTRPPQPQRSEALLPNPRDHFMGCAGRHRVGTCLPFLPACRHGWQACLPTYLPARTCVQLRLTHLAAHGSPKRIPVPACTAGWCCSCASTPSPTTMTWTAGRGR